MRRLALDAVMTVLSIAGELADNLWLDKQRDSLGITALWREIGQLNAKLDGLLGRYDELTKLKRRGRNWKSPTPPETWRCFWTAGDSEYCLQCGKHVSRHYGGNEYRCDPQ